MRLAFRIIRPLFISQPLKFSFCTQTQKLKALKDTFIVHQQHLKNQGELLKYFTDSYLFGLVQQNYCFADIVDISNAIVFSSDSQRSDSQIIFLAYSYNLFFSDLLKGKQLVESIIQSLSNKINKKQFKFASYEVEKHYLNNLKAFTNRDNYMLQEQTIALRNIFFEFIMIKYDIANEKVKYKPITEKTLSNLAAVSPYIPKSGKGCHYLGPLEKHYMQVLKYQLNRFLLKQDEMSKNFEKDTITRFNLLMEFGVNLGKLQDKFINIFAALPTEFKSQQKFCFFLKVLREFFTYQLLKRVDFKLFHRFNEQLSIKNANKRSAESVKAMEGYVESLIVLRMNNLKSFKAYFEDEIPDNPRRNK